MENTEVKPPFFKSWKGIYLAVLVNLVVMIALMYWFSKSFI